MAERLCVTKSLHILRHLPDKVFQLIVLELTPKSETSVMVEIFRQRETVLLERLYSIYSLGIYHHPLFTERDHFVNLQEVFGSRYSRDVGETLLGDIYCVLSKGDMPPLEFWMAAFKFVTQSMVLNDISRRSAFAKYPISTFIIRAAPLDVVVYMIRRYQLGPMELVASNHTDYDELTLNMPFAMYFTLPWDMVIQNHNARGRNAIRKIAGRENVHRIVEIIFDGDGTRHPECERQRILIGVRFLMREIQQHKRCDIVGSTGKTKVMHIFDTVRRYFGEEPMDWVAWKAYNGYDLSNTSTFNIK